MIFDFDKWKLFFLTKKIYAYMKKLSFSHNFFSFTLKKKEN